MHVITPKTKEDWEKYYDLRWRILRKPWNQPRETEKDDKEDESVHIMICEDDGTPVGVGSSHFISSAEAHIRWMAVDEHYQHKGVGTLVLKELEHTMKKKGAKSFVTNAREWVVDFYKKHDYCVVKKGHTLFGKIPHYRMRKVI